MTNNIKRAIWFRLIGAITNFVIFILAIMAIFGEIPAFYVLVGLAVYAVLCTFAELASAYILLKILENDSKEV